MSLSQNMFEINKSEIEGCLEIIPKVFNDDRGSFVKVFHDTAFQKAGLENNFAEEYYSKSLKGVIRGLHFQTPPDDHVKLVYCIDGSVQDVVVDIRVGSKTYGKFQVFNLNSNDANMIYIPTGMAHGFCSLSDSATLIYKTSTVHSPNNDSGILWNSIGINWPFENPIISERDKSFVDLHSFKSPFYL
jgi:dTDP-4-dehydrorhamnose 3,5-epimerase